MKTKFTTVVFSLVLLTRLFVNGQNPSGDCPIQKAIGHVSVCLPEMSGMTECIDNELVQELIKKVTLDANRNIAVYLKNNDYHNLDSISKRLFDDYLIVYSEKKLENEKVTDQYIQMVDSIISKGQMKQLMDDNWADIKNEIEAKSDGLELDRPVLIKHYKIAENVPCMISIVRGSRAYENRVYIASTVIQSLNDRFIAYAYYLFYEGETSIEKLMSTTKYYAHILNELNPPITSKNHSIKNHKKAIDLFNQGYFTSQQGNYKEAIALYSEAIDYYPNDATTSKSEAYFNRGINKRLLNDFNGAITDYTEAIKLRPDYYKAFNNRGFLKLRLERYETAILDFDVIINASDVSEQLKASAYGNRGQAKFHIGQNGCSDLQRALDLGMSGYAIAFDEKCK